MQHSIHHYSNYTMHQLLAAPYFLEWVRFPDAANSAFWEAFVQAYPQRAADITKAVAIAKTMYVVNEKPQPGESRAVWNEIYKEIKPVRRISILWKAAAVFLVAMVAAWMIFRTNTNNRIEVASRFGEVKKLLLPDSSEVTLNGNSSISYSKEWNKREVWIDGEAFFNIRHSDTRGFEVHSTGLDVNVLGTSFNIRNRRGITSVVLNSGKVLVAAEDNKKLLLSKPGDMALYSKKENGLTGKHVPVDHYTSWQQQKLQLDQVPVSGMFEMLEDDWGYHIQLRDSSLLKKKISGEIDMKDKQVLMDALAIILNANVTQQGSTIIVTPN
ncbi:FecR family protein [Chitinophaga sp. CF118]|uniref:FecR family protein n=1 Tax=Chitinophaga sp. CF118 TaxID=1884367 RepID=UPI0015A66311|nr:FecR domain-containing protein [Chitinophaga sp. CF118]